jgi:RNA recognition motif-containing protein
MAFPIRPADPNAPFTTPLSLGPQITNPILAKSPLFLNNWDNLQHHPRPSLTTSIIGCHSTQFKSMYSNAYQTIDDQSGHIINTIATSSPNDRAYETANQNPQAKKLYVGSIVDPYITEDIIREIFKPFGPINIVTKHQSIRHGNNGLHDSTSYYFFVEYEKVQSVFQAQSCMGQFLIGKKPLRVQLPDSIKVNHKELILSDDELATLASSDDVRSKWLMSIEVGLKLNLFDQDSYTLLSQYYQNIKNDDNSNNNNNNNNTQQRQDYRIYVGGGFDEDIGESTLFSLFSKFGQVSNISLPTQSSGAHRGYAFVTFTSEEAANKALILDGQELAGKKLQISMAINKLPGGPNTTADKNNPQHSDKKAILDKTEFIEFSYDINSLSIPDPLSSKYPSLLPLPRRVVPYPTVFLKNITSVNDWEQMSQPQRDEYTHQLSQDMAVFGRIEETKMVSGKTPVLHDGTIVFDLQTFVPRPGQQVVPQTDYCTLYVKFASVIEAKRCVTVVNNRLFYGRPILAGYQWKMPRDEIQNY